jgi:hypothetical protein
VEKRTSTGGWLRSKRLHLIERKFHHQSARERASEHKLAKFLSILLHSKLWCLEREKRERESGKTVSKSHVHEFIDFHCVSHRRVENLLEFCCVFEKALMSERKKKNVRGMKGWVVVVGCWWSE